MTIKTGAVLVLMAFAATLAYYIGTRMSPEAISVAVGVLCGIVASVPVSLGLLIALTRQRNRADDEEPREDLHPTPAYGAPRAQMPQIIVVAPPQSQYAQGQSPYGYPLPGATPYANYAPAPNENVIESRDWRIIGEDDE